MKTISVYPRLGGPFLRLWNPNLPHFRFFPVTPHTRRPGASQRPKGRPGSLRYYSSSLRDTFYAGKVSVYNHLSEHLAGPPHRQNQHLALFEPSALAFPEFGALAASTLEEPSALK